MICSGEARRLYDTFAASGLKLDMSRGKPCKEQLDLSSSLLTCLPEGDYRAADGTDCRNYGGVDGLPEAKALFAPLLDVPADCVIIGGNSSLTMMFDAMASLMLHGASGHDLPWLQQPAVRFLCPAPGYDRHFGVCECLGIDMVPIPMKEDGPDMDRAEALAAADASVKGLWCVPKYNNPGGMTFSDEVVRRLAVMKTRAPDFRIFWDNAYAIHHLTGRGDSLLSLYDACCSAGNPDRPLIFSSTSKITFPGAGVAFMGSSRANLDFMLKRLTKQTIGPDKVNQLRHVRFLKDGEHMAAHMRRHAVLIKPKFDKVTGMLEDAFEGADIATWSRPNGGYFISLNTRPGRARKVYNLAREAGLTLTRVGDTFPGGNDPEDRNIRIAPTFPSLEELEKAITLLILCLILAD